MTLARLIINGWIDLLLPGYETVLPADPTVFGSNDHLAECLVCLESERGLPEMELTEKSWQQVHLVNAHDLKDWLQETLTADLNPYVVQFDRNESN